MIGVINPESGNITSVVDALTRLDRPHRILHSPKELPGVEQILLPGQGRFGAVMRFMDAHGWREPLRAWVDADRPLFGICVGMQVLFEASEEDPDIPGLGILEGKVVRLRSPKQPMMGWSHVHWTEDAGHYPEGPAYFVNSYVAEDHPNAVAHTTYGMRFVAGLAYKQVRAFQFHPEKSSQFGKELMEQCLIS